MFLRRVVQDSARWPFSAGALPFPFAIDRLPSGTDIVGPLVVVVPDGPSYRNAPQHEHARLAQGVAK